MKVQPIGSSPTTVTSPSSSGTPVPPAVSAPPGEPAAAIEISGAARALRTWTKSVQRTPEIRTERVFALRTAIADDSYEIDARKIAERLVGVL